MKYRFAALLLSCLVTVSLGACTSAPDQVINTQTQVLQSDPTNLTALIERGNAFREKNDIASALVDHNRAIELAPENGRAWMARGQDYLHSKQYERAVEDFNEAIRFNPQLSEAFALRGEARVKLEQDFELAVSDLERAINAGRRDADTYRYLGQARFRLGQRAQALEAYLSSAELTPNSTEALDQALEQGLQDARLYIQRARVLKERRQYTNALGDLNQALRLNPQSAEAFEERADVYFASGDCVRAENDLRAACQLQNRKLCSSISLGCSTPAATESASVDLTP